MPTDPSNTRFALPFNYGDTGWDDELSNNMDKLAVQVPKLGALADRPAATATMAPNYYYSIDQTPVLFSININDTWTDIELSGGGGTGSAFSGSHTDLTDVTSAQHHEWPISASSLTFDPVIQSELENHTSNLSNPHDVTAAQVGAIADGAGTVTPTNLSFDPATQAELNTHASNATNPHNVTAAQSGAISNVSGSVTTTNLAAGAVTPTEVDGSGGSSGQVLQTDGTAGGVFWASLSGSGSVDWSSVPDMSASSGNTWWRLYSAGASTAGATTGSGGISIWDGVNNDELVAFREGVPGDTIFHSNVQVPDASLTAGGSEVLTAADEGHGNGLNADLWDGRDLYESSTEPTNWESGDLWLRPTQ